MPRYNGYYRHITKHPNGSYEIYNKNESYGVFRKLSDALYERDRLEYVDWNWDKYVLLPDTVNHYENVTLPPFEHKPQYITTIKEKWVVRSRGADCRYYGSYDNEGDARKVALYYDGRIAHYRTRYRVKKVINGETKTFGYYSTLEEAEKRVEELMANDWNN